MSDDKERTLPYGLDPSKIAPASSQEVDITTLKKVVNIVKKSPFQRHKEELEKRKKVRFLLKAPRSTGDNVQ
jgi:hypothetical protein